VASAITTLVLGKMALEQINLEPSGKGCSH